MVFRCLTSSHVTKNIHPLLDTYPDKALVTSKLKTFTSRLNLCQPFFAPQLWGSLSVTSGSLSCSYSGSPFIWYAHLRRDVKFRKGERREKRNLTKLELANKVCEFIIFHSGPFEHSLRSITGGVYFILVLLISCYIRDYH